jgi:hypothetical protein
MDFFKFLPIIFITTLSSVSNSIAQVKKPIVTNLNASILNKLTGIYVYEEGISTQDFQSFQRYTTDLTLEYDKINKIYKCKIKRHVLKRDGVLGPLTWYTIDGSQYSGKYDIVLKDTTIRFTWLKKQKSGLTKTIMENLFNAKIESNDINGDTMLVFSNSIKFKRTHKIENGISVEIKEKLIVDNFEVYNEDLGSFYYADALNYINKLGNGWRIPNKEELNSIYKNREKYSGLENIIKKYGSTNYTTYWSSNDYYKDGKIVVQDFKDGLQFMSDKYSMYHAIAIRSIKEKSEEEKFNENEAIKKELFEIEKKEKIKSQEVERKKQLEDEKLLREKKLKDSLEKDRIENEKLEKQLIDKYKVEVIGQPIEIEFNGYYIAEFNFPNLMTYDAASYYCKKLGWRLPNDDEFESIFYDRKFKKIIKPELKDGMYWVLDRKGNYLAIEVIGKNTSKKIVRSNQKFFVRALKMK